MCSEKKKETVIGDLKEIHANMHRWIRLGKDVFGKPPEWFCVRCGVSIIEPKMFNPLQNNKTGRRGRPTPKLLVDRDAGSALFRWLDRSENRVFPTSSSSQQGQVVSMCASLPPCVSLGVTRDTRNPLTNLEWEALAKKVPNEMWLSFARVLNYPRKHGLVQISDFELERFSEGILWGNVLDMDMPPLKLIMRLLNRRWIRGWDFDMREHLEKRGHTFEF